MANLRRLSLILAMLLLLQGCGLKFWYNRLDWVATWYVDDYVELSEQQEQQLEQWIRLKTQWHRQQELPKYIEWLEQLENDLQQGQIETRYDEHYRQLVAFYQTLVEQLGDDFAAMMVNLTDAQVTQLLKVLDKEDRELRKWLEKRDPQDRLEAREDDIKDGLSDWIGSLSKSQKALVRRWAQELKPTLKLRLDYREGWREKLQQALQQRQLPGATDAITELLTHAAKWQSDELKQRYQFNRELNRRYLIELYATLSEKQKRRLLSRLENYREDFIDLIQESP
jgi:hypothetical protein